jgi:AcrR family transcriptional regulator
MKALCSRARGRPRGFDAEAALDRAADVFQARGYEGASLDDLTAAMGVSRPSLYAAFGDKRTLFLRCLERYAAGHASLLALEPPVRDSMRRLMRGVAQAASDGPGGCLVATAAPACASGVAGVADFLAAAVRSTDAALTTGLRAAVERGELPAGFPAEARARRAADLMRALAFRARAGADAAELLAEADDAASLVLA